MLPLPPMEYYPPSPRIWEGHRTTSAHLVLTNLLALARHCYHPQELLAFLSLSHLASISFAAIFPPTSSPTSNLNLILPSPSPSPSSSSHALDNHSRRAIQYSSTVVPIYTAHQHRSGCIHSLDCGLPRRLDVFVASLTQGLGLQTGF